MQRARRSGFTLIELLAVIAVIAVLAAILLPVLAQTRERAMNAAGVPYHYDRASRQITVNGDQGTVRLTVGSSVAWANGQRVPLQAPARIITGSLYVPDRFIELATGMRSRWDEGSQTLLFGTRDNYRDRDRDRNRDDRDSGL